MVIESLPIPGLWTVVRKLPAILLRWYFPAEKLARLIYLDLQPRHDPATIDLGQSATYQIHLQLINLSPFSVELDRASFRFWCAGSILNTAILEKKSIAPGEIATLFIRDVIPDGHANQIAANIENNLFALEGSIEFNCGIRSFAKNIGHLDGIRPRVLNAHLRHAGT